MMESLRNSTRDWRLANWRLLLVHEGVEFADELFEKKALWNSFIFGATGPALLALLRLQMGTAVEEMATALARAVREADSGPLAELYERLPTVDFSRAVVQQFPSRLRVITAPSCGWTDLGTPRRVAETVRRLIEQAPTPAPARCRVRPWSSHGLINLAAQHARFALAG